MMKSCRTCKVVKSLDDYRKDSRTKDGKQSQCRECASLHYKNNAEKYKARAISQYKKDPEKAKQRHNQWKKNNTEKMRAYRDKWKENNKELAKECQRQYSRNNPHVSALAKYKRRAAERTAEQPQSKLEVSMIQGLYHISKILSNSCGETFHVDHIIPISRGGAHRFENLQILTATENLRKGAK